LLVHQQNQKKANTGKTWRTHSKARDDCQKQGSE